MSDPAEAFRKLAEVVGDMRGDVNDALNKAAPNHNRDFAELLTELRKIERKPLLGMTAEVLERRVENAAINSTREAAQAFQDGARVLRDALERDEQRVSRNQYLCTATALLALFFGALAGIGAGTWVLPNGLIASPAGCAFIGGIFVPAESPKRSQNACVFWGG